MATNTKYRQAADKAQEVLSSVIDDIPVKEISDSAASTAHRFADFLVDSTERATDRAEEMLAKASATASDSAVALQKQAASMLPAAAAKRARRRKFIGFAVVAVPAIYFLDPRHGAERRQNVKDWFASKRGKGGTTNTGSQTPSLSHQQLNSDRVKEPV
jgi:hypothetical protein